MEQQKQADATAQNEISKYKVSSTTAGFIDALQALDAAFMVAYDATAQMYGLQVDRLMDEELYPPLAKLKEVIEGYLIASISENLGIKKNEKDVI